MYSDQNQGQILDWFIHFIGATDDTKDQILTRQAIQKDVSILRDPGDAGAAVLRWWILQVLQNNSVGDDKSHDVC